LLKNPQYPGFLKPSPSTNHLNRDKVRDREGAYAPGGNSISAITAIKSTRTAKKFDLR
jgi:hypothetical protein